MTEPLIAVERRIAAPPHVVFAYLVDPLKHALWMGTEADLDPRPDGVHRVVVRPGVTASGAFITVDPPHRVVYSFGWEGHPGVPPASTEVEITLTPDGDGTLLRLVHRGMPAAEIEEHTRGWNHYVARLALAATGGEPGPD